MRMDQRRVREIERLKTPPSLEEFEEKYMAPGVPVIIEGAFTHWKANEWTLESLKAKAGNAKVHVRRNTQSEEYRLGKAYDTVEMSFKSYIDRILAHDSDKSREKRSRRTSSSHNAQPNSSIEGSEKEKNEGSVENEESSISAATQEHSSSSTSEADRKRNGQQQYSGKGANKKASQDSIDNFYLAVQNVKRVLPELEEDISPLPKYVQKLHMGPFLWIAPDEHYEYTHFDPDDGMLFVVSGEKRVRLFHYTYLEHLYPNPLGSDGRTIQATVNVEEPDLKIHPLFSEVIADVGVLRDGDCLFIPAFYWHQVSSSPRTISINTFYGDTGDKKFAAKIFESRWRSVTYWLLNIIEQNRQMDSFAQVAANLQSALAEFFFKQWHEKLAPEVLQRLETQILKHLGYDNGEKPTYDGPAKKHIQLKIRGLKWRDSRSSASQ